MNILNGYIRAILPAVVAVITQKYPWLAPVVGPELLTGVVALGSAIWSHLSKLPK